MAANTVDIPIAIEPAFGQPMLLRLASNPQTTNDVQMSLLLALKRHLTQV